MFSKAILGVFFLLVSPGVDSYAGVPSQEHLLVWMPINEVRANNGDAAELFCDYRISSGEDRPVTVTWKAGGSITEASPILRCRGYTHANRQCSSVEQMDPDFYFRVKFVDNSLSMEILQVEVGDDRNYWCEVQIEGSTNLEMDYDMKSVVLHTGANPPKLNSLVLDSNGLVAYSSSSSYTLECSCGYSTHCDDVVWYRGPMSNGEFELIYSRIIPFSPTTGPGAPVHTVYGDWKGRVSLIENSLEISSVQLSDTGRYWCEIRAASYKTGLNPYTIDAKSMVLEVDNQTKLQKL